MSDLFPLPGEREQHPEQERSFHELRAEFRAANLARIRSLLTPLRREVAGKVWCMMTTSDAHPMPSQQVIEAMAQSIADPSRCPVLRTFDLDRVPEVLRHRLHQKAEESLTFDTVSVPGGVDHDGPPLHSLTEQSILDYMEAMTREPQK